MIKLGKPITASAEQMIFIIEGMRNPMNSWEKSDSYNGCGGDCQACMDDPYSAHNCFSMGDNDYALMEKLAKAGIDHRKFMRMMPVYVRITAPLYWWKEFDTYKVGTVANSCSTMHKIMEKEFTLDDFSFDQVRADAHEVELDVVTTFIGYLNAYRELYLKDKDKAVWNHVIQLLPSSYNQTRNVMMNYEVLANIYKSRKNHKLDEWRVFCSWIENCIPYSELITGIGKENKND